MKESYTDFFILITEVEKKIKISKQNIASLKILLLVNQNNQKLYKENNTLNLYFILKIILPKTS